MYDEMFINYDDIELDDNESQENNIDAKEIFLFETLKHN